MSETRQDVSRVLWAYPTAWDVGNWGVTAARTITWGEGEADGISTGSSWITGQWQSTIFVPEQENCTDFWVPASGSGETEVQCAIPTNFRKVGDGQDLGFGRLRFTYTWDSSTGTKSNLSGCEIGEVVTYPQMPFPAPFPDINVPNPTVLEVNGAEPSMTDLHETNGAFRTPFSNATFVAAQIFRYKCSCNGNQWVTLMGPHNITRTVFQEGSTWKFKIEKHGDTATKNLP